ncbi:MAG TPA: LLM class flavin-dependent oxidoreductase [Dehalococcoidia bacterium]|nr:LLM class flavin-dependent oxidoreductase [Dehalococcoidia bacterium]
MHLGLFMECDYRRGATEEEALAEAFDLVQTAENTGLDAVWLAERHFASAEQLRRSGSGAVPSIASAPLLLASAMAARTSRLRLGIAVSVLPLSHPVRLAEEIATLDHISGGRFDFGVGRSGFATSYAGYGIPYEESRERFQECLDILLLAWTQETFSYTGKHYSFSDVCVVPKPRQKPYPPIRIAATTSETFPMVGRLGYPIFIGLRGSDLELNAANLAIYRQSWHEAGHPGSGDVFVRIPMYVAETAEAAYEEPRESTLTNYRQRGEGYSSRSQGAGSVEERAEFARRIAGSDYDELLRTRLAYGTPDAVARRLADLRDELGLAGFLLEPNVGGGISRERVFKSVRLFAEQVAPLLR